MKVLILAGGFGTRLSEETDLRPKPLVHIGEQPILWHIMKLYSSYGYNDFVLLLGYKSYMIKEYFANYFLHQSDVTIDISNNDVRILNNKSEPWKITLLETGMNTMTGGRILRAKEHIGNEPFLLTYGDGVSNVNIGELVSFHKKQGKLATMTSVQPEGRFGMMTIDKESSVVSDFLEKPKGDGQWINGGFFVCQPEVLDYIKKGDSTVWENSPLENLSRDKQLVAYQHNGFWRPMDTLKDKQVLTQMWEKGEAEWKVW
ncbi:MAG: glucose-1-phosphate cytidylyltransferase [Bacteroidales bacterium]|nr:glucose-1-phosphate cytidylyltransferase [Bacteroidales bacterium]